jgi:hypothetical protein
LLVVNERAPPGYCECGCGQLAPLARQTNAPKGGVKGQPLRFVHGHNRRKPRGLVEKECTYCGEVKPVGDFYEHASRYDGLRSNCITCEQRQMRANYQRNRSQRQMQPKQRRHGPERERVLQVQRDGYWRNAEANRERSRSYAADHRKEARERTQNWKRANPGRALANSKLDKLRRRLGRDAEAFEYADQVLRYDQCAYCGALAETIDHIDPLSRGVNNGWDLTAACGTCNYSKHDSRLLLFLHRRGTGGRDPMRRRAGREVKQPRDLARSQRGNSSPTRHAAYPSRSACASGAQTASSKPVTSCSRALRRSAQP